MFERTDHWGKWIVRRGKVVGFRSQKGLAAEIGCSEDQLSRWVQRNTPPDRMRKGFSEKLPAALHVTPEMVFVHWATVPPELAAPDPSHVIKRASPSPKKLTMDEFNNALEVFEQIGENAIPIFMIWLWTFDPNERDRILKILASGKIPPLHVQ